MTQSLNSAPQKQKFSVAINSKMYQNLIASTLRDPARARRFSAAITSAVAVNPALQECDAGTILAGALLGESLNLSPSPQLGSARQSSGVIRRRRVKMPLALYVSAAGVCPRSTAAAGSGIWAQARSNSPASSHWRS